MASGTIDTGWYWFYTNSADPGGPAVHEANWQGEWWTEIESGHTRLYIRVRSGMRIYGNNGGGSAGGSSYFASGVAIRSSDRTTGLTSNHTYQWGFNITASDNAGVGHSYDSGWIRADHDYGNYEPGWSDYVTFNFDYTTAGTYTITLNNDIQDSPNHSHIENDDQAMVQIEVTVEPPDYRPGQRRISGVWQSCNRDLGECDRRVSGSWSEMRTQKGDTDGQGDPPYLRRSSAWYNQKKIGANA
jgi:hypothetical protein